MTHFGNSTMEPQTDMVKMSTLKTQADVVKMSTRETQTDVVKMSKSVSILGTGHFARALAKRLITSGYDVTLGTRFPERRSHLTSAHTPLASARLTSLEESIERNDVIFLAVGIEHLSELLMPHADRLTGKVLVDVTNRKKKSENTSNADYLADLFPQCNVVKAFNVISAYAMADRFTGENRHVFVAGNDVLSRDLVMRMSHDMGLHPVDMGGLRAAVQIENFSVQFFPGWIYPVVVALIVIVIISVYSSIMTFVVKRSLPVDQIFLLILNRPIAIAALIVLSLAYLPGCVAAFVQLWRGSVQTRFPKWLDTWMESRKQFGLTSVALVIVHVTMSMLILRPNYYPDYFRLPQPVAPGNASSSTASGSNDRFLRWWVESSLLLAVLGLLLLLLLAISSLPSVADTLHWREWRFLQSRLGHVALLLATAHVTLLGAPQWVTYPMSENVRGLMFWSVQFPYVVFLLRLLLLFPCLSRSLTRIRGGWERVDTNRTV